MGLKEFAQDSFNKASKVAQESVNKVSELSTKAKDFTVDKINSISGKKLLEENLKYYEQVTQILIGIDGEISKLNSNLNSHENKIAAISGNVSALTAIIDQVKNELNKKYKPNYLLIISIIIISNLIIGVVLYYKLTGQIL